MALYYSPDYQTSSESVGLSVQEKKFYIDFWDDGHLGFPIRTVIATFILSTSNLNGVYRFFSFGFYSPFNNISLISSRSFINGGRKPENPGKTP